MFLGLMKYFILKHSFFLANNVISCSVSGFFRLCLLSPVFLAPREGVALSSWMVWNDYIHTIQSKFTSLRLYSYNPLDIQGHVCRTINKQYFSAALCPFVQVDIIMWRSATCSTGDTMSSVNWAGGTSPLCGWPGTSSKFPSKRHVGHSRA